MNKICALPGCGKPVGLPPWTIAGWPEYQYCSRACTDVAFKSGRKARQGMQVPAPDFGDLLTRTKCDVCGGPVLINWGRSIGKDCCSRECQKKAEDNQVTDTETNDTTNDQKPITAGAAAPAKKKSGKKAPAKAAPPAKSKKPAKKAAAPSKAKAAPKKAPADSDGPVRSGSNMEILLKLVQKAKGASLDEMATATGWEKDMCARTLNNLKRKGITIVRGDDGQYTSPK